ncbi:MAG: porin [Gammaproteobacteria bacterium]|nr:MAG: porin [Gammaproteobacteria bacterium]
MKFKTLKGAALVAATSMLPISQVAMAEGNVNISGWVNEGIMFYDDGVGSDVVQSSDNGTTLNSRITFTGSYDLPSTSMQAGFEITMEPTSGFGGDVFGTSANPLIANQEAGGFSDGNAFATGVTTLASNIYMSGGWGKLTIGTQSMPTDNIAVLEDPSMTLWTNVSPVFRGGGFTVQGLTGAGAGASFANFLQCIGTQGLGIGIDCNGIYRNGIRYDLPAFGPVTIAIGYANDDIYDVAAKYKGDFGNFGTQLALGYSVNNGLSRAGQAAGLSAGGDSAETFQMQAGAMHKPTGIFGAVSYQHEEADGVSAAMSNASSDSTDSWYFKGGIKKQWFSIGDTSIGGSYGQYHDQYGVAGVSAGVAAGVNGSEVDRYSFGVTQYFGSRFQVYGNYENLDLDVDCASGTACVGTYNGSDSLDMFTLGGIFFF